MSCDTIKTIAIVLLIVIVVVEFLVIRWLRSGKDGDTKIEDTIKFFRSFWFKFVFYVIATSIIGLFVASFVYKNEITLTKMNEWVSLVLGLVALFIGIISLFLSFYNVDQAYESQKDNLNVMHDLQKSIEDRFANMKDEMQKGFDNIQYSRVRSNSNIKKNAKNEKVLLNMRSK